MKSITLDQIRQAVGGRLLPPSPQLTISSICTDSRHIEPNSLFIALRGDNMDGHAFLSQAAAKGAVVAMVDHAPENLDPNLLYVLVRDTRKAMGLLAQYIRRNLNAAVIGVAGSNGKTGTKRLIDAALQTELSGTISPKSFNNDIGVPLTIFAASPFDEYLVIEIGTNHHGEIAWLTEIAEPNIAVITNCSAEHLEGLTDLDGVRRENAAIIQGMTAQGLLVVNGDDTQLLEAVSGFQGRRVTFGFSASNDLWPADVTCGMDGTRFKLNGDAEVFVPLLGRHTAVNALAAIAVGRALGVPDDRLIAGLSGASGPEMRLQLKEIGGISILNDAYNANPASMAAALETLRALPARGRRIAVLGEMRELGDWQEKYHREVGAVAAQCKLDALVCVGPAAGWIAQAAQDAGMESDCVTCYPDAASAAAGMVRWLSSGDLVLLKASRAIGLEHIANAVAQVMGASVRAAG